MISIIKIINKFSFHANNICLLYIIIFTIIILVIYDYYSCNNITACPLGPADDRKTIIYCKFSWYDDDDICNQIIIYRYLY